MTIKNLVKSWSLPDRSTERAQITLRIPFNEYARLHALKEAYPNRSVNDILTDIIKTGLDEIVEALPSYKIDEREADALAHYEGGRIEDYLDSMTGPRVTFDVAYRRILEEKPEVEAKKLSVVEEDAA